MFSDKRCFNSYLIRNPLLKCVEVNIYKINPDIAEQVDLYIKHIKNIINDIVYSSPPSQYKRKQESLDSPAPYKKATPICDDRAKGRYKRTLRSFIMDYIIEGGGTFETKNITILIQKMHEDNYTNNNGEFSSYETIRKTINRLTNDGFLERTKRGLYTVTAT